MPAPRRTPPELDSPDDVRQLDRWRIAGLVFMLVLIVAFPIYNAGEPARRAEAQAEMAAANIRIGRTMFAQHCASCHGDDARGGRTGPTLASREFLGVVSDQQLHWLISGGVPGSTMPAYDMDLGGPFTSQEITRLAAYLRSLEAGVASVPGWYSGVRAPATLPTVAQTHRANSTDSAPPRREESRDRRERSRGGEASATGEVQRAQLAVVYAARCAMCHGAEGQGTQIARALRPLRAPYATDADTTWSVIARGMPGTTMAAFSTVRGGPLDDTTIRAIVSWLQVGMPVR